MNITISQDPTGRYVITPDHPSFEPAKAYTIYTALSMAKSYIRANPGLFDGIVIGEPTIRV